MFFGEYDYDLDMKIKAQEAAEEKAEETARNCLKEGDSPEKVSRCTGLPLEQVLELQKQIPVKA